MKFKDFSTANPCASKNADWSVLRTSPRTICLVLNPSGDHIYYVRLDKLIPRSVDDIVGPFLTLRREVDANFKEITKFPHQLTTVEVGNQDELLVSLNSYAAVHKTVNAIFHATKLRQSAGNGDPF